MNAKTGQNQQREKPDPYDPTKSGGIPNQKAEKQRRLQIIEHCLSLGITKSEDIKEFLESQINQEVPERTLGSYIKIVRDQLTQCDADMRVIRKSSMIRATKRFSELILKRLSESKKVPDWKDYIEALRFQREVEMSGIPEHEGIPLVGSEFGNVEDKKELDDIMDELLGDRAVHDLIQEYLERKNQQK